jgi:membrane associated rhomboid family serine protease
VGGAVIPLRDDIPTSRPPVVTVTLIVICVAVFLWQTSLPPPGQEAAVLGYGMIPAVLLGEATLAPELVRVPPAATLVTSMFLHGGWGHLLGNMLYLWIFANNIEDRLGHVRFALFYLAVGLAAAAAQILPDPASPVPMIGASGAISGVLGAYMLLFPHARVLVLIPLGFMFLHRIRAVWLLGIWFAMQILSASFGSATAGGVAWWAHIGGFIAGFVLALPLRRPPRHRRGPWG